MSYISFLPTPTVTGFVKTQLIISTVTATFYKVDGPDVRLSLRANPVYFAWGNANNTAPTASGTPATQMDWLPVNSNIIMSKPIEAEGIWIIQDTGAGALYITSGRVA